VERADEAIMTSDGGGSSSKVDTTCRSLLLGGRLCTAELLRLVSLERLLRVLLHNCPNSLLGRIQRSFDSLQ
jgi:hypothetical protein